MSKEYIEREVAKKVLAFGVGVTAANALDNVPAADVAPVVHGRWSCDSEDGFDNYDWHCDMCGGSVGYRCGDPVFSKYCPHCGARMDGE